MHNHTKLSNPARMASKAALLLGAGLSTLFVAAPAFAQDNPDEIVVTGTRQVIQDSIALKRENTQIVDGLFAEEIGDLPALSIGEALESITGVASHRENGGATEVSIRGLGPYLSSTVVNGRAATNGSGDRSVNFSQFPSELVNKLAVFKTQDASQIEGGVAGQIQIDTLKPLDYGKRRLQFDLKGNVNPDQLKQSDTEADDIGYRGTLSYVDQFEMSGGGEIGISLGVQRSDISQPEAESRQTSSGSASRPACVISDGLAQFTDQTNGGTFTGFSNNPETRDRGDDDCDDFNDRRNSENLTTRGSDTEGVDTTLVDGVAIDAGVPFAFAPSQRHYRQNDTRDERDSLFAGVQFKPNNKLDINLDVQWSERTQSEQRSDLTFNGGRRNDTSLNIGPGGTTTTLDSLVLTPQGGILRSITDNTIEVQGGDYERVETYLGGGLNIDYQLSDRLSVSADYGYSNTKRNENNREFRIQSDISPVIEFDQRDRDVPVYTLYDEEFDVNNHDNYVDRLRVRIDNDLERNNTIHSGRLDFDYDLSGSGFFTNVETGIRWAEQSYLDFPGGAESGNPLSVNRGRFSFEIENDGELTVNNREVLDDRDEDDDEPAFEQQLALQNDLISIIGSTNSACRTEFPEGNSFLSSLREGDLITNIDDDGTVLSSTNSWATFDSGCIADTAVDSLNSILGAINAYSTNPDATENSFGAGLAAFSSEIPTLTEINSRTIDVKETTQSLYAMTGYETKFGDLPVSGNMGLRVVQTNVTATGYRPELIVGADDDGGLTLSQGDSLEAFTVKHDYTRFLPSAIAIIELAEDKIIRLGAFRAMSRADPADMGASRNFEIASSDDEGDIITTVQELIADVSGSGNPAIDPLMSWNFDAGFEWYPNDDTIVALSGYYKNFQGGFVNVFQEETYSLNGQDASFNVSGLQQVSEDSSDLYGLEFTGSHNFSYLPGLLSGFGAKISYNYVESNFEFEDSRYGDIFEGQEDGSLLQINEGIIAPGGLPGLSKHTLSAQAYYQIGDFDMQVNYKYRDNYFQPFTANGTVLRYVGDVGVWEARASYDLNENFRLSVEAINLFSEPKEQFAFVDDDRYEINDYGPRIFFGLRGKF
jgi:outer membrane receptor protein involved in Fe transport